MITFKELGKYGRLGNQMFQIAGTIGIATKHGYKFGFPKWINHDHKSRFGSSEDCDIQKYFKNHLPAVDESKTYPDRFIHWGYQNVTIPDNVSISGHMQSEKYFAHCEPLIKHYFEFDESIQPNLPTPNPNDVAIHIRLGDYDNNYHPRLGMEYYGKALDLFNGTFYVFTDDVNGAKDIFGTGFEYVEGNHYTTDLYYMTKFKNHIIGNSTFSWWGSYLANSQKTAAPFNWFGKIANLSPKDIYRKNWIIL